MASIPTVFFKMRELHQMIHRNGHLLFLSIFLLLFCCRNFASTAELNLLTPDVLLRHRGLHKEMMEPLGWNYIKYEDTTIWLKKMCDHFEHLCSMYSIGTSVQSRRLWVIKISSDSPRSVERKIGKPMFKYVGNIHGNEVLSRQLLLYLIQHLLINYGRDEEVTSIVNSTEIHIIPSMNPDGYEIANEGDCPGFDNKSGRLNAHGKDLNRNFPSQWSNLKDSDYTPNSSIPMLTHEHTSGREPETIAAMEWITTNPFVLSGNLHGGAVVASYPFDDSRAHFETGKPSLTPDNDVFVHLAKSYAFYHPTMHTGNVCQDDFFKDGITNGAEWYDVPGGMQDFNYIWSNCFEISIELSCCKYPNASQLESEWRNNSAALMNYMKQVHLGVKGVVLDSSTREPIEGATVSVEGNTHPVATTARGEYWRLLIPGTYNLLFHANGYNPVRKENVRLDNQSNAYSAQWLEVLLDPIPVKTHSPPIAESPSGPPLHVPPFELNRLTTSNESEWKEFSRKPVFKHHNFTEMESLLKDYAARYPHITRLYSIGKSIQGRDLWVMEITDHPGIHEPLEPEFKYVANMHGNEVIGRFLCLLLIQALLESYGKDLSLTKLVDDTRIHIFPSMNPDGFEISEEGDCNSDHGRFNAHRIDLNRNFPDQYTPHHRVKKQPETLAVMKWLHEYPFVLSANLHGGSLVANYPFDGNAELSDSGYSKTPDDATFRYLALAYSKNHALMHEGKPCEKECTNPLMGKYFENGITNGADWYTLYGGMQDYNYLHTNCFEITLELGCFKYPYAKDLEKYWRQNRVAIFSFIEEVHRGIKGLITDQSGNPLSNVTVHVEGINHDILSAAAGDYWRLLAPGEYNITFHKKGYTPFTVKNINIIPYDWAKVINVTLNYGEFPGSQELGTILTPSVMGVPRPVFVIAAASVILTLLVCALCIYNFVSSRSSYRKRRGFKRKNGSFDEYEYSKFTNRDLIPEYDEEDSEEDELYNSTSLFKKRDVT